MSEASGAPGPDAGAVTAGGGSAGGPAFDGVCVDEPRALVRDDAFRVTREGDGFLLEVAVPWVDDVVGPEATRLARGTRLALSLGSPAMLATGRVVVLAVRADASGRRRGFSARLARHGRVATLDDDRFALWRRTPGHPLADGLRAAGELAVACASGGGAWPSEPAGRAVVGALTRFANLAATRALVEARRPFLVVAADRVSLAATPTGAGTPRNPYARFTTPLGDPACVVNLRLLVDLAEGRPSRHDEAEVAAMALRLSPPRRR